MQFTGKDRLVYGRSLEAVRDTGVTLDAAAMEYSEAWKPLDGVSLVDVRQVLRAASWSGHKLSLET
jgi:hypothetical protein